MCFHAPAHKAPEALPVYAVAEAKVVDFYAAYRARQLKRAAARERVVCVGFEEWFARVYLKEAA